MGTFSNKHLHSGIYCAFCNTGNRRSIKKDGLLMSLDEKAEANYYKALIDLLRVPRDKEIERVIKNGNEYIQKWREIRELKNDK